MQSEQEIPSNYQNIKGVVPLTFMSLREHQSSIQHYVVEYKAAGKVILRLGGKPGCTHLATAQVVQTQTHGSTHTLIASLGSPGLLSPRPSDPLIITLPCPLWVPLAAKVGNEWMLLVFSVQIAYSTDSCTSFELEAHFSYVVLEIAPECCCSTQHWMCTFLLETSRFVSFYFFIWSNNLREEWKISFSVTDNPLGKELKSTFVAQRQGKVML